MATRTSRWLFLSLALVLYIRNLLGQTNAGGKVVEANIRVKIDTPGVLSLLQSQLDSFTSPIAVDSNGEPIEGRLPSPILASEPLTFDPPSLHFEEQSVGMPQLTTVKVVNPSRTQNLHLNSISGESHVFHTSFFKSKVVKAGENEWTTFDVVFLPRVPGPVQDTLYIHTSHGTFDFKVQGVGVQNPFRMRPLLGARIPINATYSPLITMYNPFETTLQITEMYSSGGNLHLELLSGQLQGSKSLWEIRPYETKPIARANFYGREAVNHTSFIRVKTSLEDSPSIVLPVEVEVSDSHGLYLSRELLDFGILKSGETKSLPLFVLNSGPHTVHIKSISVVPDNPSVVVEPTTSFLKPGSKYLKIASVTLTPTLGSPKEEQSGHLEILAEDDRKTEYRLQVPFDSTILQGTLAFEKSQTMFRVGKPPFQALIRNVSLANHFSVPLVLYDIRLSSKAQDYFTVLDFHGPFTLPPTAEWHRPFALQFLPTSSECLFNTTLRLSTNASLFNIPFYCYDGRVEYTLNSTENLNNEDVLDYGVLAESDSVTKHFFLVNPNPIRITIVSFLVSDSIPFTSVELLQIEPADMSVDGAEDRVQIIGKKQGAKGPFYVGPDMVAVFRANITNPKKLGTFTGELLIHTSFDRVLRVPVYYKTAVGSVKILPEKNVFPPNFPYGVQKLPLVARSYYPQTLDIREVHAEPPDKRFYFITERTENIPHLKPQALTELGTLVFDPLRGDPETIYVGTGDAWSVADYSSQLDAKSDRREFSMLWDTWSGLQDDGLTQFNFSYVVYTAIDTTVPVPTEASLVWPTLYPHKELLFPQTTIGNSSIQTLKLTNPSRHPVVVQPVLLHYYPQPQKIVQILFESGSIENIDFSRSESSFSLDPDSWGYDTSLTRHILVPGTEKCETEVRVKFLARESQLSSSLLILRNNLTGLEYVVLRGRGLEGKFSIDGVQPDSTPLLVQFTSSDLERCTEGTMFSEPLRLTKVFRMHNSGAAPMRIQHVGLGPGGLCDGNGFGVSNCNEEIVIQTNKTKKLELLVFPDFTLSRIETTLTLQTTEDKLMTYPLSVLIPHNMLAVCYALQPHPEWEDKLGRLVTPVWLAILFFVAMMALVRTNFGIVSPGSDGDLPTVQPTGGAYFDFGDITKALHNTLIEKLDSLKKGVDAAKREQAARKPPDKHSHHKPQRTFSTSPNPPPPRPHPTPPGPPSYEDRHREPPESTSELRRRVTQQMTSPSRGDNVPATHSDGGSMRGDMRKMDTSSSSLGSSSVRKLERHRHTSEPAKKAADETLKPGSTGVHNQPQGHHMLEPPQPSKSPSSQGQNVQKLPVLSNSAPSDQPPAMTTDQETGMRKYVEQQSPSSHPPSSQQQHDTSLKVKKPAKPPILETPSPSSSTLSERRSSTSSSASSSSAPTPLPQRRGKGVRRTGNSRPQKASPVLQQQSTAKLVPPHAVAIPTPTTAAPQIPLSSPTVQDHLERKESDGSLQSTDSESTSSTSEKSEKDEMQGERTESNPPLAKEPGTGQTIPLLLAQEEFIPSKCKGTLDKEESATSPLESTATGKKECEMEVKEEVSAEREVEVRGKLPLLPTPRLSKKKLKQQQRKEDKQRRKEREKERYRERDGEERRKDLSVHLLPAGAEVVERQPLQAQSLEESDEHVVPVAEPLKVKKTVVVSPKKGKKIESKTHPGTKSAKPPPSRSKTAPARVVVPPRSQTPPPPSTSSSLSSPSPLAQQPSPTAQQLPTREDAYDGDGSPDVDQLSHTWGGTDLEDFKESPEEPSSPTSQPELNSLSRENSEDSSSAVDQLEGMALSSHPMEAIPISALRAMRAKGTKQYKYEEDEGPPPKKGAARKAEKLPPRIIRTMEKSTRPTPPPGNTHTASAETKSSPQKKLSPKVFADDISNSTDETPSPEPGNELTVKSKSLCIPPTSPHEIAATLLSKNPALKKRKVKNEDGNDPDGSDEADEGKYEKPPMLNEEEEHLPEKVLWARDGDSPHKHQMRLMHHYKTAPTTLSLDAEPFYPSSDYVPVPQVKRRRSHHHPAHTHADTPYVHSRQLNTPPGFPSAEESGVFERKYRVREVPPPNHLSLRAQHLHGNALTPSPPPYPTLSEPLSLYYPEGEGHGGVEPSELSRYPRIPTDISSYEIHVSPEEYYSTTATASGRRVLEGHRSRLTRSSGVYDDRGYLSSQRQQQHAAAVAYAAAQRRERELHALSRASPNASLAILDQPNSYLYTQEEESATLLRREIHRQRLLRKYQEEQAKLHARHALDPHNHPSHRPTRSTLYAPESPPSSNLWEVGYDHVPDSYPSAHQSDDAFLTESIHLHQLRQQQRARDQLMQEHLGHAHPRHRRYSSDNELGGEILPDHLQMPSSPSHVSSSAGLNKAPGTAFSGMAQARRVAAREHDMWSEKQEEPSTWANNIWSLDPPLDSSDGGPHQRSPAGFPSGHAEEQRGVLPGGNRGNQSSSSYLENTYDLFQDKNIWGNGAETPSANILPWGQLKPTELSPSDQQ